MKRTVDFWAVKLNGLPLLIYIYTALADGLKLKHDLDMKANARWN